MYVNKVYIHVEKFTNAIRNIRTAFYRHLERMNPNRRTERLFNYLGKLKMLIRGLMEPKKTAELHITQEDIKERLLLGKSYVTLQVCRKVEKEDQ